MEALSILVSLVLVLVVTVIIYIMYMSRHFNIFKEMGVSGPKPKLFLGNLPQIIQEGFINFHLRLYKEYHKEKAYGIFEPGRAFLIVKDLDMIRDISIKNFNSFVNRRVFFDGEPFDRVMTTIKDDHWRRVRNFVSPSFSSGKLKRMSPHVEETARTLVSNLRQICKEEKAIELADTINCYSMDVIASTGFGVQIDSLKNRNHPFVVQANNVLNGFNDKFIALMLFCPFLAKLVHRMGLSGFPRESATFFHDFVDKSIANRSQDQSSQKRQDFLQMMINAEETSDGANESVNASNGGEKTGMTRKDIQGQTFIFITATYENLSKTISFTLFLLAHHPECCRKVQEELDEVLGGKLPNYENFQELNYLDMCLNEMIRLYPPGYQFDRECNEDCTVQGIHIPKGVYVVFPAIAIHRDPELWPEPEKFDPERFSAEQKANRHPFAHLPFGQGPRNCVGMRLALLQVKIALASILQEMTPVPCEKSVYPITLQKHQMRPENGLWVKFVQRQP